MRSSVEHRLCCLLDAERPNRNLTSGQAYPRDSQLTAAQVVLLRHLFTGVTGITPTLDSMQPSSCEPGQLHGFRRMSFLFEQEYSVVNRT